MFRGIHVPLIVAVLGSTILSMGCNDTAFEQAGFKKQSTEKSDADAEAEVVEPTDELGENPADDTEPGEREMEFTMPTPEDLAKTAELCANQEVTQTRLELSFDPPAETCAWGQNDNMPFDRINHQLVIAARREQAIEVSIPSHSVLCGVNFEFEEQDIVYDDEIILTMNQVVLASSQNYGNLFNKQGNYQMYGWPALKGKPYPINDRNVYCLGMAEGKGNCVLPPTQRRGRLLIDLHEDVVRQVGVATGLSALARDAKGAKQEAKAKFSLVTTGDNDDPIDCKHSGFKFALTTKTVRLP